MHKKALCTRKVVVLLMSKLIAFLPFSLLSPLSSRKLPIVGCYMLRSFAHPVACCWMFLPVVAQSLKPVKIFSQQLPTFLLLRDRRSVAQQCWIRLHSSSNIVGATHAHYAWFTKTYGLYPSHDALQVPILLGVVASVCTPLPTRTQQLPTLFGQQCWELLHPSARSVSLKITYTFSFKCVESLYSRRTNAGFS